jgi:hypothetical protein
MNYADGQQPVYERSLSHEEMERMLRVKEEVDSEGLFGGGGGGKRGLWKGGFRLPDRKDGEVEERKKGGDGGGGSETGRRTGREL